MTPDWTKDVPDEQLVVVRLSCGHAKIVRANVGVPGPGSSTWCDQCGKAVGALRYVARSARSSRRPGHTLSSP